MTVTTPTRDRYDAIVVGARCAGAATAMLLARQGVRVLALERTRYGSDALSTHALMRAGVLQLRRWGVLDAVIAAGTPPVRTTSFTYGDETTALSIKPRDGVDALYAPRRTVLDVILQDEAARSGAEVAFGLRVVDVTRNAKGSVCGVAVERADGSLTNLAADVVIGADGLNSTVARAVGAEIEHAGEHATGVVYGYFPGFALDGYHWYWRPGVCVGVVPTNDGDACIFVAVHGDRFRAEIRSDTVGGFRRVLAECAPEVAATVAATPRAGTLKAFAGARGFLRRSWGAGWALVGDAGYFKDPITAHGITDALRDAELLARTLVQGSPEALADYQASRDDLARGFLAMTDRIASFEWTLEELAAIHVALNKEMKRDEAALLALGPAPARAATAPAPREARGT